MFVTKIKSLYHTFTISEMKIADYLIDNRKNISSITSSELADILGMGQSTIIRFSQKIGYRSYKQLIADIVNSDTEESQEIQINDSTYVMMDKMITNYNNTFKIIKDANKPEDIDAAIHMISRANRVLCFGFLATGAFAQYMQDVLMGLGKNIFYSSTVVEIKQNIMFLEPGIDCIILISKTGETDEVLEIAEFAKKKGVAIIGISNLTKNTLMTYSDIHLKILETSVRSRLQSFYPNVGVLYMIDTLVLGLFKKDYTQSRSKSSEYMKSVRPRKYKDDE